MGKKYFDKNIKNKLEELDIEYDASSWDSFEKKLDAAMSDSHEEDLAFDEQIKEKMQENLQLPFEEEHWQELSSMIDYENELTNKIYLFKIVELAILVMLAYSFFQIEPIKKAPKDNTLYAHSHIFDQIDGDKLIEESFLENTVPQDNLRKELASNIFPVAEEISRAESINLTEQSFASSDNGFQETALDANDRSMAMVTLEDKTIDKLESNSAWSYREKEEVASLEHELEANDFLMDAKFAGPATEKWISFSGSADVNLVNAPTKLVLNSSRQLLNAAGYSTRISYGVKTGKNEVEIGAGYSYKDYDPDIRESFSIDGESFYSYSLNRIEFHIAQVALNYKRYIVDNNNWSAYVDAGVTPNFILFSDFDTPGELKRGPASTNSFIQKNSTLLSRNYPTGLLQNVGQSSLKRSSSTAFRTEGDIFDNAFITTYLGFGVQKNIGLNRALFLQTGYHHQFFGDKLGPNQDQINTLSFTLGGKFRI